MIDITKQSPMGLSLSSRAQRWWKAQSPDERKAVVKRGALGIACTSAVLIGMPMLASVNVDRQDAQEFRERNVQLAAAQDAGTATRADAKASPLLRHDWLRSVEYSLERDPGSALSRYAALERDRAALSGLNTLEIGAMSRAEDMVKQTKCLSQAVYYEARSERTSGQLAVAEVIMNRVRDHRYPNSICGVVYQGATRTTGCQFTFTCDGALNKRPRGKLWDAAQTVAEHVVMGLNESKTSGATHYHATYVNPVWNSGLVRTRQIGTHIFYRFPRGGEWAAASARQNRRLEQRRSGLSAIMPVATPPEAEVKVIKTAAPVKIEGLRPIVELDLNAAQLRDLTAEPVAVPPVIAASQGPAPVEVAAATTAPIVTRRIVRRVVDGVVVQEREIPVASSGQISGSGVSAP
ncbi:MAG: cell wall hydrolase [Henriciella sp.]|nr:cell wall hydrolase [Henriciella sp.]